jgi:hypothetical protein
MEKNLTITLRKGPGEWGPEASPRAKKRGDNVPGWILTAGGELVEMSRIQQLCPENPYGYHRQHLASLPFPISIQTSRSPLMTRISMYPKLTSLEGMNN